MLIEWDYKLYLIILGGRFKNLFNTDNVNLEGKLSNAVQLLNNNTKPQNLYYVLRKMNQ